LLKTADIHPTQQTVSCKT